VRLALVFGTSAGSDTVISEDKIRGMRNFTNKIWNASRFTLINVSGGDIMAGELGADRISLRDPFGAEYSPQLLTDADKKILEANKATKAKVQSYLEKYQFSQAAEALYDHFWHDFCDVYVEAAKAQLSPPRESTNLAKVQKYESEQKNDTESSEAVRENTKKILIKVLSESLQLLHPFIPFVTEAVWQELREVCPELSESVMISSWPARNR